MTITALVLLVISLIAIVVTVSLAIRTYSDLIDDDTRD